MLSPAYILRTQRETVVRLLHYFSTAAWKITSRRPAGLSRAVTRWGLDIQWRLCLTLKLCLVQSLPAVIVTTAG